jgi:hypothetical protein
VKALIIGAGICGPVTAMALQRAGIGSIVYEAHRPTTRDVGSYLTVATNGLRALAAIEAETPVLVVGFPTSYRVLASGTGKHLGTVPNGSTRRESVFSHTIKRAHLHRALRERIPLSPPFRSRYGGHGQFREVLNRPKHHAPGLSGSLASQAMSSVRIRGATVDLGRGLRPVVVDLRVVLEGPTGSAFASVEAAVSQGLCDNREAAWGDNVYRQPQCERELHRCAVDASACVESSWRPGVVTVLVSVRTRSARRSRRTSAGSAGRALVRRYSLFPVDDAATPCHRCSTVLATVFPLRTMSMARFTSVNGKTSTRLSMLCSAANASIAIMSLRLPT